MTSPFTEKFTGLYATPELIGRVDILNKFARILQDSSIAPRLIFLHGVGGIGKTRLLHRVLDMARELESCRVADAVMDFYNIGLHTPIGLANAIFEILTPPFDCFQAYQSAYQALNRARLSGNVVELEKLREDATNIFDQDLKQLTASKRVVLALDTAERIVYGLSGWTDEIPLADAWKWLMKHLLSWQNVIVFVAGREEAHPAIQWLGENNSITIEEIEVGPFNLNESMEYFDKVSQLLEKNKEFQFAERLKNFPRALKEMAYAYSDGRPILLSLLVDYLSFPGESDVEAMLREVPSKELGEDDYWRYEEVLFNRLRQEELGETLIALGRVPKGADDELLAVLMDISLPEARKHLEKMKRFSVVKIRPEDQRIFLHDEVYALLQRHVFDSPYDLGEQKKAFSIIKKYYTGQRVKSLQHLDELYAPVEEQGKESLDMELLSEAHVYHQTVMSEMLYYFLRHNLGRGFRNYYRYSHEAIHSRDILMDLQLQAELLSFLSTQKNITITDNVSVEFILASLKIRPIVRNSPMQEYRMSIDNAMKLLSDIENEWKKKYPPLLAYLYSLMASINIGSGNYKEAENNIKIAFSMLPMPNVRRRFDDPISPDTLLWYMKVVRAWTHRINGYLKRIQGFLNESVKEYQNAASLLREVDLRVETAIVFNDMGFAQAERGEWYDGGANVRNALSLRRELGHRIPIGLSLNTLATIDVREGQYATAQENAERALSIFRAFSVKRYVGMSLTTMAEAIRRDAGTSLVLSVEERVELLRRARDYAREASGIFSDLKDTSRQVEALIELGCACRDWVWWRKSNPRPGDNLQRTRSESEDSLNQAVALAEQANLIYRHVDALVNLAWLQFYLLDSTGKSEISDQHPVIKLLGDAELAFPNDSEIARQPQVWAQKGKLYVLKGHIAFYKFERQRVIEPKGLSFEIEKLLYDIAENYSLGLDYSSRFALDYQGIRQAKDGIFNCLKYLNAIELLTICSRIKSIYPKESIIQTFLINRGLWQMD